ncbi:MAG: DUF3471 domain-containing protein, partial [Boseongicola sp.]|nr:DUF3471 domain-containing protein [Boseongicola sp.]
IKILEHQLGFQESPLETAIKETQRRHVSAGSPSLDVGLGWFITSAGSDQIHWHNGATMGQNSFVGFNLRTGVGVAVMANARLHQYSSVEDLGLKILIPAVPLNSIRRPATLNDSERDRFLGQYYNADGPSISIGRRADHLTATSSLNPAVTFTLYPSSSNRFHLYEAVTSATLRFILNPDGQPTEMQWTQEGETTFYTRTAPPGRLRIAVSPTGATLHIEGDSATVYHIESSPDLNQWQSLMQLRGNESTSISISNANAHRFFRIR